MNMYNFLYSGYEFSEDEDLLKYKFRILNTVAVIIAIFSILFGALSDLGLNDIGEIHSKVDYLYSFLSLLGIYYLRRSKENYLKVTHFILIISLLTFTSALIFVPQDEFRIIWFYLLIYVSYMLSDSKGGVIYTILSILVILISSHFIDLQLSQAAINSGVIGLLIASLLSRAYNVKITSYERDLHLKNEVLHLLASTDGLTGIMNKRNFNEVSQKDFESAQTNSRDLSLLILDIDYFKRVNDTYGHGIGDQVLCSFCQTIKSVLRASDIFARIGGEEFAVLLFETSSKEAFEVAQKIRKEVEQINVRYKDKNINITTSIGLSKSEISDKTFHDIFERADKALFQAKEQGRNQVCVL